MGKIACNSCKMDYIQNFTAQEKAAWEVERAGFHVICDDCFAILKKAMKRGKKA